MIAKLDPIACLYNKFHYDFHNQKLTAKMKKSIYRLGFPTLAATCIMFFAVPLSAQVPNAKITQLECQISGSEELMGGVDRIREIIHIQVFDDSIPKIMIKGNKLRIVVMGANATNSSGFKAIGVNRSTEDIWDMASSNTGPDNWRFNNEVRINRFTGSITLRSISTSPQGIRATTEASGICSAMKEGQRKF